MGRYKLLPSPPRSLAVPTEHGYPSPGAAVGSHLQVNGCGGPDGYLGGVPEHLQSLDVDPSAGDRLRDLEPQPVGVMVLCQG